MFAPRPNRGARPHTAARQAAARLRRLAAALIAITCAAAASAAIVPAASARILTPPDVPAVPAPTVRVVTVARHGRLADRLDRGRRRPGRRHRSRRAGPGAGRPQGGLGHRRDASRLAVSTAAAPGSRSGPRRGALRQPAATTGTTPFIRLSGARPGQPSQVGRNPIASPDAPSTNPAWITAGPRPGEGHGHEPGPHRWRQPGPWRPCGHRSGDPCQERRQAGLGRAGGAARPADLVDLPPARARRRRRRRRRPERLAQARGPAGKDPLPAALPGWLATTTRRECGRILRVPPGARDTGQVPDAQAISDDDTQTNTRPANVQEPSEIGGSGASIAYAFLHGQ